MAARAPESNLKFDDAATLRAKSPIHQVALSTIRHGFGGFAAMKGEGSPKAQATFKQSGMSRSQIFDGLSSALDFSVRLLQSHPAGDISELTIRDAEGQIAFTHDEIERLSALVRLSGSPRKPPA